VTRDRRAAARVSGLLIPGMNRARLRPGLTAHIVDLSSGGALIETDWRLLPGARVELQFGESPASVRAAGRILRSHVALLGHERIRYRGAVAFEDKLPFGEDTTPSKMVDGQRY
jgi:hypothetical protein